jgi:hypothetical protein
MPDDQNFEPYIDWDDLSDEMADDLSSRLTRFRKVSDLFIKESNRKRRRRPEKIRAHAAEMLRLQYELSALYQAIVQTLVTVPMMVHVAGEKKTEQCESIDHDHIVQRCTRCGSMLQSWHANTTVMTPLGPQEIDEEDVTWWTPGSTVAKSGDTGGPPMLHMYEIEDRELEKHEMVCVDLAEMMK